MYYDILNFNKMKNFEKIIEFIFKKRNLESNSLIIILGFIPKRFKEFLNNLVSLKPHIKIIYRSKKEHYWDISEIVGYLKSIILIASYNNKKNTMEIILKQAIKSLGIRLNLLNITSYSSGIFLGNLNKFSRSLIFFQTIFEERPELKVFKILISSFLNPNTTDLNILPSYDHLIAFFFVNSKILLRIYQISNKNNLKKGFKKDQFHLVEIGPRFVAKIIGFKIE